VTGPNDELAFLCAELPQLRAALNDTPERRALLEQAVQAAAAGQPFARFLRDLGVVASDEDPGSSRGPGGGPPWNTRGGHVVTGVYVCPVGACGRVAKRGVDDAPPLCHLRGQPLRFVPDDV
jgi:hypothetical protein